MSQQPPSFDPWLSRVRIARMWVALLGFVLVGALSYTAGHAWEDALLRGLGASVACFFVGWASALWICGELYNAQIARLRAQLSERERERERQITEMYQAQLAEEAAARPGASSSMHPSGMRNAA